MQSIKKKQIIYLSDILTSKQIKQKIAILKEALHEIIVRIVICLVLKILIDQSQELKSFCLAVMTAKVHEYGK